MREHPSPIPPNGWPAAPYGERIEPIREISVQEAFHRIDRPFHPFWDDEARNDEMPFHVIVTHLQDLGRIA